MNTEKIEKLKKSLSNSKIPADLKPKIEAEIKRLESLDALATEKAKEEKEEAKEEAKPVAKTRKPRAKKTSTAKPSQTSKPKRTAMSLAKEIRKEGESWKDAQARASKMMKEGSKEVTKTVETELDKLSKLVKSKKELRSQVGRTNLLIDAKRKAKPMGRRISKDGNVYYENRANRTDRGTYGKYHLAEGGYLTDPTFGTFQNQVFAGGGGVKPTLKKGDNVVVIGKRWFDRANGNTYHTAMVLVNGQSLGKSKMTYGYEEQYLETAKEILLQHYNLPKGMNERSPLWQLREYGVTLTKTVSDGLKRELATGGSITNERRYVNKGEDYEVRYAKPRPSRKGYKGVRGFELGGVMATDLAGHTGGGDAGFNAGMPLDGFSNTSYTGLVGETGAMSSGEMFMNGGGLPSGSSQSYMITESFGNPAQHYARGGGVDYYEQLAVYVQGKGSIYNGTSMKQAINKANYYLKNNPSAEIVIVDEKYGDIYDLYGNLTEEYAKGGGVRQVGNREYSYGRNWTNDHRHVNKSEDHEVNYKRKGKFLGVFNDGGAVTNERKHVNKKEDYEVRYAKPRPSRKGYKGARKFMAGGMNNETPRIYVADLEAYNNGRLVGEWLDLSDYNDADELMDAIQDVLKKSGGEEYAIHDYENFPSNLYSEYMSRNDFQALYDVMETAKQNNLPLEVVQDIVSQYGEGGVEEFYGKFDSAEDFAYQQVEEVGLENFSSPEYYVYITDTDRRLLAGEMADSYVDNIKDEDGGNRVIEEAGMDVLEYQEADNETQEEMLDKAVEIVRDEYYDNWYDGLSDPYYFLVDEQGMYSPDDFFNASFISVDYEKLARDLEQDYTFIEYDGDLYVFNIR
jgi:antirestriction protein